MEAVEPLMALVIYSTTADAQARQGDNLAKIARSSFEQFRESEFGRAAVRLAAELHPQAFWLRECAVVDAP